MDFDFNDDDDIPSFQTDGFDPSFLDMLNDSPQINDFDHHETLAPPQNSHPPSGGTGGFTLEFTPEPGFDDAYDGGMFNLDPNFANHFADFEPPPPANHITTVIPTFPPDGTIGTHRKCYTQPITRPIPPPIKPKGKSKHSVQFQTRSTRKIPINQPVKSPPEPGSEDDMFQNLCHDKSVTINPHKLGFIPSPFWPDQEIPFGDIVADFFQRKNNVNCRFSHKLYNAIQIGKMLPHMKQYSGVEWLSNTILKVNKKQFARLLGIHSIDGSLFHQQGNFSTHGFSEVSLEEARNQIGEQEFNSMDLETVKLLKHNPGIFLRSATEQDLERCKWVSSKKKPFIVQ